MNAEITAWFTGRLPDDLYTGPVTVRADREEILVTGPIEEPQLEGDPDDTAKQAARAARVKRFREETRDVRVRIAAEAEHLFDRKVSWGVQCGPSTYVFTNIAVPVMTRLRLGERQVLDTLIDAGVARSRSEALAWCVRLVEKNQGEWIDQLRDALKHVSKLRDDGPSVA